MSQAVHTKFSVKGMDCAVCVSKIETAVSRIDGVSDVNVVLTSATLTANFAGKEQRAKILATVSGLGYRIAPVGGGGVAAKNVRDHTGDGHDHAGENHGGDGHDHGKHTSSDSEAHDHSEHGQPIEGAWWLSPRGKIVIATALLIGLGYILKQFSETAATAAFLAACAYGTFTVAKHALAAAKVESIFNIESLMTIAVIGAVAIQQYKEVAIVVCLFAVGELLEGIAAGRARSGIKALAEIAPKRAMLETPDGLVFLLNTVERKVQYTSCGIN